MRILLGTDGSAGAGAALDLLLDLRLGLQDEVIVLVAVHGEGAAAETTRVAEQAAACVRARGASASILLREGAPAEALYEVSIELAADLVVIGSRGLGAVRGALFGSTARALARICPVPLLVVRGHCGGARRVLVAAEDDEERRMALALLKSLPLPAETDLTVTTTASARDILRTAERSATDLIVLESRADPLGRGYLHGSVADQILSEAHCAVLIARDRAAWLAPAVAAAASR